MKTKKEEDIQDIVDQIGKLFERLTTLTADESTHETLRAGDKVKIDCKDKHDGREGVLVGPRGSSYWYIRFEPTEKERKRGLSAQTIWKMPKHFDVIEPE